VPKLSKEVVEMMHQWRMQSGNETVEYRLGIEWDSGGFEEGHPTIRVFAGTRHNGQGEFVTAEATVEIQTEGEGHPQLIVKVQKEPFHKMPLADLIDESQIIDRIPAALIGGGDPFTGCLIRAGLSAVVGQVISCKQATRDVPWNLRRLKAMGHCMREHLGRMGTRAARKALRCVLRLGF
jgi:hypothetical protein